MCNVTAKYILPPSQLGGGKRIYMRAHNLAHITSLRHHPLRKKRPFITFLEWWPSSLGHHSLAMVLYLENYYDVQATKTKKVSLFYLNNKKSLSDANINRDLPLGCSLIGRECTLRLQPPEFKE